MAKSFILYQEYKKHISLLSQSQKGDLLDAIFSYNEGGALELDPIVKMAFSFIESDLDRNKENYKKKEKRNSDNGKIGNLKRWYPDIYKKYIDGEINLEEAERESKTLDRSPPDEPDRPPIAPDRPRSLNDNDNDNVNDNVNNIVKEKSLTDCKKKNYNDFHFEVASSLANLLEEKQKRKVTNSQIESWASEIRLLMERDMLGRESPKKDVLDAFRGLSEHFGEQYFPQVESGKTFRKKFFKIETNLKAKLGRSIAGENFNAVKNFLER